MKRIFPFILTIIMCLSFAACGNDGQTQKETTARSPSGVENYIQKETEGNEKNDSVPSDTQAKVLVVYYSWSGNTAHVAQRIAANMGADTYEIRTVDTYPEDGHETAVVSQKERRTGNLPGLVDDLPDISGYDTIYIGGPVWNSYMPTPLENYLEMTDFTGKIVIPFSTSQGSGQSGFQNDFKERVQNPETIGEYKDFTFPDNYSPDAFTDEEIDGLFDGWLPGIGG